MWKGIQRHVQAYHQRTSLSVRDGCRGMEGRHGGVHVLHIWGVHSIFGELRVTDCRLSLSFIIRPRHTHLKPKWSQFWPLVKVSLVVRRNRVWILWSYMNNLQQWKWTEKKGAFNTHVNVNWYWHYSYWKISNAIEQAQNSNLAWYCNILFFRRSLLLK